jgi:hypothetical protein
MIWCLLSAALNLSLDPQCMGEIRPGDGEGEH